MTIFSPDKDIKYFNLADIPEGTTEFRVEGIIYSTGKFRASKLRTLTGSFPDGITRIVINHT